MERLTDRKTAAALKKNADGLKSKGIEPNMSDLRYIKLAEYENREERGEFEQFFVIKSGEILAHKWLKFNPYLSEKPTKGKVKTENNVVHIDGKGIKDFIMRRFNERR